MGMNKNIMYVIAFFLGLLIFHLLKGNCGCNNVVEGQEGQEQYQADIISIQNSPCPDTATVDGVQKSVVKIEFDHIYEEFSGETDKTCGNLDPTKSNIGSDGHGCKYYKQYSPPHRGIGNPYYKQCSLNPLYTSSIHGGLCTVSTGPSPRATVQCKTLDDCIGSQLVDTAGQPSNVALCASRKASNGCDNYQNINEIAKQCIQSPLLPNCKPTPFACTPSTSSDHLSTAEMAELFGDIDEAEDVTGCC